MGEVQKGQSMKRKQTQLWRVGSWRMMGNVAGYYVQLFIEVFVPLVLSYGTSPGPRQLGHSTFVASGDKWHRGIQKSMVGFWFFKAWSSWGHQRTQRWLGRVSAESWRAVTVQTSHKSGALRAEVTCASVFRQSLGGWYNSASHHQYGPGEIK